jgi:ferredoxin-NADP reductase
VERPVGLGQTGWQGYRSFRVASIERETTDCVSVYLEAVDRKPIAPYWPGQHVAIRTRIAATGQPPVRCYSLSDAPSPDHYRLTVKAVAAGDGGPGLVSHWINHRLREGEIIDLKAPTGSFYLDVTQHHPIVMIAGGVGITPMMSMVRTLALLRSQRPVLLFHASRNSAEQIFQRELADLAQRLPRLSLINCYSQPLPADRLGVDYHVAGRITVDLIKQCLRSPQFDFYMCGPAGLMQDLAAGLIEWGTPPERIHTEAFGPSSLARPSPLASDSPSARATHNVTFARSKVTAQWSPSHASLLELAEACQVPVSFGCRAGSCGSCLVPVVSGEISYDAMVGTTCPPQTCLMCLAKPAGDVVLEL